MKTEIIQSLITDGIYEGKIPLNIIDYWNKKYFEHITTNKQSKFKKEYNQYFYLINHSDLFIQEIFYKDILSSISYIYNSSAKIRDIFAVLTLQREASKTYSGHAGKWHTDIEDSFAFMILLNDISINDTHMQFILKEKHLPKQQLPNLNIENKMIKSCVGEAGTFFLFNNGNYIHRQNLLSNKNRKTLHAIYLPENSPVFKKN